MACAEICGAAGKGKDSADICGKNKKAAKFLANKSHISRFVRIFVGERAAFGNCICNQRHIIQNICALRSTQADKINTIK